MTRKRANIKPKQQQTEPLDEDDQTKLIRELEISAAVQEQQIRSAFGLLCKLFLVLSTAGSMMVEVRSPGSEPSSVKTFRWSQQFVGIYLYTIASRIVNMKAASIPLYVGIPLSVYVLLVSVALWHIRSYNLDEAKWLHQGLAASNLFIITAAFFLRWDHVSTQKSLRDLKEARYKFKSL